jgi:hypothetical protein
VLIPWVKFQQEVLTAAQSGVENYEFVLVLLTTVLVGLLRAFIIAL